MTGKPLADKMWCPGKLKTKCAKSFKNNTHWSVQQLDEKKLPGVRKSMSRNQSTTTHYSKPVIKTSINYSHFFLHFDLTCISYFKRKLLHQSVTCSTVGSAM